MKKTSFTLLFIFLCFSLMAQYKKASFFGKEGRTYGLGAQLFALGDGKGSPIGYTLSFGRDREGNQFFSSWELTFIPSYKFAFSTTDVNDDPIAVSGKTKPHFIYALNYGYHLLKNESEEQKLKPYVTAGFNFVLMGGVDEAVNNNYDNKKVAVDRNFGAGAGGGLGLLVNFAPRFSFKAEGGYRYQLNISLDDYIDEGNSYNVFTSHPYISAGIRFRISSDQ